MSLSVQQTRSSVPGESPEGLLPGQLAFNLADNILFLGNGSDERTDIGGNPVLPPPPAGQGWVSFLLAGGGGGGSVNIVQGAAPIQVTGSVSTPVVSIDAASVSNAGAVQLADSTSSTSTTLAATANAVRSAYNLAFQADNTAITAQTLANTAQVTANAALPKAGGTMTGNISFKAGQTFPGVVTSVSATGGSAITVDNADPTQPAVGVSAASTSAPGVVQLNNTTTSTSTTEALTAARGKALQDQINVLSFTTNLTFAGTFDANTGLVDGVTPQGTSEGFVVGDPLPAAAVANDGYFVIVDVAGSTGPAGTPPYTVGDWFVSDGVAWQFLNVGLDAPYASTTVQGEVILATDAQVQTGSNTSTVVTPAGLQSKLSDSVSTTSSAIIASSTAAKTANDAALAAGTAASSAQDAADQAALDAAAAQATADAALPTAGGTMTGDIVFSPTQTFPPSGVDPATTSSLGVVQIGSNIDVSSGIISVAAGSTSVAGVLQLTDATDSSSTTTAATPNSVKLAYNLASGALLKSGGTMTGDIVFSASQTFPGTSISDATTSSKGVVQIGDNIQVASGVISVNAGSTTAAGVLQLTDSTGSSSTTTAATPNSVKNAFQAATSAAGVANTASATANAALPRTGGTMTGNITFNAGQTFPGVVTGVTGTAPVSVTAGTAPVVSVAAASTTAAGVVQLNNTTSSTSTTQALTANQGRLLQNQIDDLLVATSLTLAGTFDATAAEMLTVTSAGEGEGFTIGDDLPNAAVSNTDYFVIVTNGGTYTPPGAGGPILTLGTLVGGTGYTPGTYLAEPLVGGTGNGATADITVDGAGVVTNVVLVSGGSDYTVGNSLTAFSTSGTPWSIPVDTIGPATPFVTNQGDWLLSNGALWEFLNVGVDIPTASTSAPGIVQLATNAETGTGTDATLAVTPAGAKATYVPLSNYTACGSILVATAASTPANLALGTDGQVLTVDSAFPSGVKWGPALPVAATPLVAGTVLGCTTTLNAALGRCALGGVTTATCAVAIGWAAAQCYSTGSCITAVGTAALPATASGNYHTAIGALALCAYSASNPAVDNSNVALGALAGKNLTSGGCNVIIGPNVNAPVATGSCQLVIGFNQGCNWLTGCSNLNIKPGAGIIDAAGCVGTAGQLLTSTGTGLAWCSAAEVPAATPIVLGTVFGCTKDITNRSTSLGQCALASATGADNTTVGFCALSGSSAGEGNTAFGSYAMATNGGGGCNVGIGFSAMRGLTTGVRNVGVGENALRGITTGCYNVAVGPSASCGTSTALYNTAVGYGALFTGGNGGSNTGVGSFSLSTVSTGCANTSVGLNSGRQLTTGSQNTFVGVNTSCATTTGGNNTAVGAGALLNNLVGVNNTALGLAAGQNSSGNRNVFIGSEAGCCTTAGDQNVAIGNAVDVAVATGSCQLAIGFAAGQYWLTGDSDRNIKPGAGIIDCLGTTGTCNQFLVSTGLGPIRWRTMTATPAVAGIVFGCTAGTNTSLGISAGAGLNNNVYIGLNAACNAGSGVATSNNVVIGSNAGRCLTTGSSNTVMGCSAGLALTSGNFNVAIGGNAGCALDGTSGNIAIGFNAGCSQNTGCGNTYLGTNAALSDVGCLNTYIGGVAGRCATTGCYNVALGEAAFATAAATTACSVTAIGQGTLRNTSGTGGCNSVALGTNAGCGVSTGICNIFIGVQAGYNMASGNSNIAIGTNVCFPSATGSCQLAIGVNNINWLSGDCTFAIKPGAGIIDCAGCCGTAGQVLSSTGANAVKWSNGSNAGCAMTRNANGITLTSCASYTPQVLRYCTAVSDSTSWYNSTTGVFTPTVPGWYQVTAGGRIFAGACENVLSLVCNGTVISTSGGYNLVSGNAGALAYMNGTTDAMCVQIRNATGGCSMGQGTASNFSAVLVALP
jgi:hypothetical protein